MDDEELDSEGRKKGSGSRKREKEAKLLRPPRITYGQKCEKHDLIIHSYIRSTQELLCTKCIYERNLHSNQIETFP